MDNTITKYWPLSTLFILVISLSIYSCGESLSSKKEKFEKLELEAFEMIVLMDTIKVKMKRYEDNVIAQLDPSIQVDAKMLLMKKKRDLKLHEVGSMKKKEARHSKIEDFKSIGASVYSFLQNPHIKKKAEEALAPHLEVLTNYKEEYDLLREAYMVNQITCYNLLEKNPRILDDESREAFMISTEYVFGFGKGGEMIEKYSKTSAEEDLFNFASSVLSNSINSGVTCPSCSGAASTCGLCGGDGKVSRSVKSRWMRGY